MNKIPIYPLTVIFHEDGEKLILENETEVAENLEWIDSEDPEENVTVIDRLERPVHLIVEELDVKVIKLISS